MPRTAITAQAAPGGDLTFNADLTWAAADASNLNYVPYSSRGILLARNDDAGAQTVIIQSVATATAGRDLPTATETKSIAAGEYAIFGPFPADGWRNTTDDSIDIDASDANVFLAWVTIPS